MTLNLHVVRIQEKEGSCENDYVLVSTSTLSHSHNKMHLLKTIVTYNISTIVYLYGSALKIVS